MNKSIINSYGVEEKGHAFYFKVRKDLVKILPRIIRDALRSLDVGKRFEIRFALNRYTDFPDTIYGIAWYHRGSFQDEKDWDEFVASSWEQVEDRPDLGIKVIARMIA